MIGVTTVGNMSIILLQNAPPSGQDSFLGSLGRVLSNVKLPMPGLCKTKERA